MSYSNIQYSQTQQFACFHQQFKSCQNKDFYQIFQQTYLKNFFQHTQVIYLILRLSNLVIQNQIDLLIIIIQIIKNLNKKVNSLQKKKRAQMGNSNHSITFYQEDDIHVRELCSLVNDGKDISFKDGYLISHLLVNATKKIKIVTVVGETGNGKSSIIELITSQFTKKPYNIFHSYAGSSNGTIGIQYFITSLDENTDLILFDCEGFENAQQDLSENYIDKLYLLIAQIARLSTITIYISTDERVKKPFIKFLEAVDIEDRHKQDRNYLKKKGILSNFIELLNKQGNLNATKSKHYPIFQKSYFISKFKKIDYENDYKNRKYLIEIDQESLAQLRGICEDIKQMKFSSIHQNTESFNRDQSCRSLYEVLIGSVQILKSRGLSEKKHFAEIINLQLHQKNYVIEQVNKMNKEQQPILEQEIKELLNCIPKGKYSSISIFQIISQAKQFNTKSKFASKIKELEKQWRKQFAQGLTEILKINKNEQNDSVSDELVKQYTELEGMKPIEFNFQDRSDKISGKYIGLGMYAIGGSAVVSGMFGALIAENSTFVVGTRGVALFGIAGFVVSGILSMLAGIWLFRKHIDNEKKISCWKKVLRSGLISSLNQLHLGCQQSCELSDNSLILQHIITASMVDSDQSSTIFGRYTRRQTDLMIPLFYFNLISKSLKEKNIKWIQEDDKTKQNQQAKLAKLALDEIAQIASRLPEINNQQEIKQIIIDVLNIRFTNEEKNATKGKNIAGQFNLQSHKVTNTQITSKSQRIIEKCANSRVNDQNLINIVSSLLLLKLSVSDIFYSIIFSFFFPIELLQTDNLITPEGIKNYFEFQDQLLNTEIRS
ncbi:transmembrane protein, putative (macronuclear) [Tetrahymena thermophila SB210]|uniref:Transmembrane protein, putative n=1 Tax=Tetrahymena thermophila (strain SB210) TaxID=312017 RepID=Q23A46_TETTS|nr:transmembrane protein, putative [Tetrahymena thermophila SB210]EAR93434.2 transmembrane protein, putative [Tetrahymena thermophila SB210]|eukprot:XP_001013679.2 transmembrane protein, putative [Tetrahymena thermophila SB210]